jgi:PTH1 family peptidyl-tRNA hydrolase
MRSVIYQLGFDDFPRVRIGIGKPEGWDIANFVLSKPTGDEASMLNEALKNAADAVELIVKGELGQAQAKYNGNIKKAPDPSGEQ